MLSVGGTEYMIDFDALGTLLTIQSEDDSKEMKEVDIKEVWEKDEYIGKEVFTKTYQKGTELDMTKYEMVRMLFEVVLTYDIEIDETLGVERGLEGASLPFKLAFNTLIEYGIIKEIE